MTDTARSVTAVASLRVDASENPARFRWLTAAITSDLAALGLLDRATAGWTARDNVLLAAEIEAMAGVRRLAARSHPDRCKCDPCQISKDSHR